MNTIHPSPRRPEAQCRVLTPFSGTVASLDSVPDPVFASGAIGAGIAVIPDPGVELVTVTAPLAGVVTRVLPHLYLLQAVPPQVTPAQATLQAAARWRRFAEAQDYPSVLIQLGIDTARLEGEGFNQHVEEGQFVPQGAPLCTYAPRELGRQGFDPLAVVVGLRLTPAELDFVAFPGEPINPSACLFRLDVA